jgi:Domain of unknown function (DUF397)
MSTELGTAGWRKSTYSGGTDNNNCIEVADGIPNSVPVRDSKDPSGPVLTFSRPAWTAFIASLKAADLPRAT